jgi:ribonuclease D
MSQKLDHLHRLDWPQEEFLKLQDPASYTQDDDKEFLSNTMLNNLKDREKLFLLRLYRWRQNQAREKNLPKERILQKKYIPHFVKAIKGGKDSLMHNRLLPEHIVHRNAKKLVEMYESEMTGEEKMVIDSVSKNVRIKPRIDAVMDILYLGIKIICSEQKIAPELVINRSNFKRMKGDLSYFDESLEQSWRYELLGRNVINSIRHRNKLKVDTSGEYFSLKM